MWFKWQRDKEGNVNVHSDRVTTNRKQELVNIQVWCPWVGQWILWDHLCVWKSRPWISPQIKKNKIICTECLWVASSQVGFSKWVIRIKLSSMTTKRILSSSIILISHQEEHEVQHMTKFHPNTLLGYIRICTEDVVSLVICTIWRCSQLIFASKVCTV